MKKHDLHHLLDRLADEEARQLTDEFLAPAVVGGVVHVRLGGVLCRFRIDGVAEGWGVFRPTGPASARFVRPATLAEQRRYLDRLPRRRLILCEGRGGDWLGSTAHGGDRRFPADVLVRLRRVADVDRFETVEARFDGAQCWFDRLDPQADPAAAAYLREAWRQQVPADGLHRRGLTAEQHAAYGAARALMQAAERDQTEARLRTALAHGGAQMTGYAERPDGLRVEYDVDGERHVSFVDKQDLTVQLAGICLNGEDRRFDLPSLIGVLREAAGDVLRIGEDNGGMSAADYRRVHPPREGR